MGGGDDGCPVGLGVLSGSGFEIFPLDGLLTFERLGKSECLSFKGLSFLPLTGLGVFGLGFPFFERLVGES